MITPLASGTLSILQSKQVKRIEAMNFEYLNFIRQFGKMPSGQAVLGAIPEEVLKFILSAKPGAIRQIAECGHNLTTLRQTRPRALLAYGEAKLEVVPNEVSPQPLIMQRVVQQLNLDYLSTAKEFIGTRHGKFLFGLSPELDVAMDAISLMEIVQISRCGQLLITLRVLSERHITALAEGGQNARAYSFLATRGPKVAIYNKLGA